MWGLVVKFFNFLSFLQQEPKCELCKKNEAEYKILCTEAGILICKECSVYKSEVGMENKNKVTSNFHAKELNEKQIYFVEKFRIAFANLANELDVHLPPGRIKALTMTNLEQAAMWATKSISNDWENK
jgi:hypothetical protein